MHNVVRKAVSGWRLILAVALPVAALLVQWLLWQWIQPFVWFLAFPAVFLSARLGGRVGALIATFVSVVGVVYFFMGRQLSWALASDAQWLSVGMFLVMGWMFGEFNEQLLRKHYAERDAFYKRDAELAAIVDSTDDAIMSGTLDGRITSWNPGAERLYGFSEEEALGQALVQQYPAVQRAEVLAMLSRVAAGETITGFESRRKHKNGSDIYISATISPIHDDVGQVSGASMVARDISQRIKDQDARKLIEARFESLFNAMEEGFYLAELVFDDAGNAVDWRYLDVNPAFSRILNMPRERVIGESNSHAFPHTNPELLYACIRVAKTGVPTKLESFDGVSGRHFISNFYSPKRNHLACIFFDITDRKCAEQALRETEARYARVLEGADQGFWEWDLVGQKLTVSPRLESILGYPAGALQANAQNWASHIHPDDYARTKAIVVQNLRTISPFYECELRCRTKTGEWRWVLLRGKVTTRNMNGYAQIMSGTLTDISTRRQAQELIWQQANYDALTQLPNRSMLRDRLGQEIRTARQNSSHVAILFIDLDNFKEINDTQGHDKGDLLLIEAARRIKTSVRDSDTVSRQGGDEFTVVIPHVNNLERVQQVAQSILATVSQSFDLQGETAFVSASIGIALFPDDAVDVEGLKKCADQALYAAKDAGKNRFSFFTKILQETAQSRVRLVNDLRQAISGEQLRVVYQPIVDMRTGDVHKAEALLRWQHPQLGLISPAEFIPVAESSGLIIDIGEWVFQQAAVQVKKWRQTHHAEFQISVNKSPVQFANHHKQHGTWVEQLHSMGLPGQCIAMEITEGLLLAPRPEVVTQLSGLRVGGIGVSLDDFGTGYSSLSYLQKFDIDYLKIDQSFVRNLSAQSKDMALCKAIIVMAHELGIKVIAEGIETEAQRESLALAGCDYGQGYFFSRPIAAAQFEIWLNASSTQSVRSGQQLTSTQTQKDGRFAKA